MPLAKVAIVMFSPAFFKSKACVQELIKICTEDDLSRCIIPVYVHHMAFTHCSKCPRVRCRRNGCFHGGNHVHPPHWQTALSRMHNNNHAYYY